MVPLGATVLAAGEFRCEAAPAPDTDVQPCNSTRLQTLEGTQEEEIAREFQYSKR